MKPRTSDPPLTEPSGLPRDPLRVEADSARTLLRRIARRLSPVVVGSLWLFCTASPGWSANVEIDAATTYQVIDGFGSSERLLDEPHVFDNLDPDTGRAATVLSRAEYDEVMDLLYLDLALTRIRPLVTDGIEAVNDNDDPYLTDLSAFDFEWVKADGHVDYVSDAVARGADTFWLSPLNFEVFMTEDNPEEYVEWVMAVLNRWRELGLEMPYYSLFNEPTYRAGIWGAEQGKKVIKLLGPAMRAEGFDTMIVAADEVSAGGALSYCEVLLADEEVRQYVGAIGFHLYGDVVLGKLEDKGIGRLSELAAAYDLPLWMTEFSGVQDDWEWGVLMHDLIAQYDVAAVDMLFGGFGQRAGGSTYIRLLHEEEIYLGPDLTKKYYYTGHYSRFVKPGALRVSAISSDPAVLVTAYQNLAGDYVFVAINTSDEEIATNFAIQNAPVLESVQAVRTSDTEDWAELPAPVLATNSLDSALPARSFTTFVLVPEPGALAQRAMALVVVALLGVVVRDRPSATFWTA